MHWAGVEGEFNVLVMDLLGPTIEELFNFCENKFSIKTVLWIASELVARIEAMHKQNFIHRDLKTENLCIGIGKKCSTIYLIDFGLSKRFKCPKSGMHVAEKRKNNVIGTLRFCSTQATNSYE